MKSPILLGLALVVSSGTLWSQTAENDLKYARNEQPQVAGEQVPADAERPAQITQSIEDATNIKVIVQKNQTIEEYRQRGELIMVKVIPNDGVPYYIDPLEREKLRVSGRDLINSGVKPVRWVLKEF